MSATGARTLLRIVVALVAVAGGARLLSQPNRTAVGSEDVEWLGLGGDAGSTRYSPLTQIDRSNVDRLRIAWRRPAVASEFTTAHPEVKFGNNRSAPLMVGGVLYAPNAVGLVEAFDAATGATIWAQEPPAGEPLGGTATRGVAMWRDGAETQNLRAAQLTVVGPRCQDRQAHDLVR